jgi:hypothetical protein
MKCLHGIWFLCICGLLLASCSRPQAAKSVLAAEKPSPAQEVASPMLIDSYRKIDFQPGIQLHVWNVRALGLKELSISLLVIRDGKRQTASRTDYKWDKWDISQPLVAGQIVLLMHDGQQFGVKDKRLPILAIDFAKLPDGTQSATTSNNILIEGALNSRGGAATGPGSLMSFPPGQGHKAVLYGELFAPVTDLASVSLTPDLDALIKAANSGRTVVAVCLEWATH